MRREKQTRSKTKAGCKHSSLRNRRNRIVMKIPSSWKILPLQEVALLQTGLALNSKLKIHEPVNVPYLRVANVQAGYIELNDLKTVVVEKSTMQRFLLLAGDVLLTEGGDFDKLGRGAVWREQISPCLHQNHVFSIRTNAAKLLPEFLSYQTESNYGRNYFLICSKQSTNLASINSTQIKNFPVILPPLVEQQQITEFLGTWDEAIEKLERLIAAKKKRLNWIRANILTGKVRLKNHYANWKLQHLASILDEHKEKSSGQELVHSVSVHKGVVNQIEHLGRNFAAKDTSNYNLAKPGDIIYTKSPTGDFPYGIIKLNQNDYNVIVSPLYGVFTPKWPELGIWLDCYFEASQNAINYLHPIIQKGAKNTINITNKIFLSNVLLLPTEQNEVQEICQIISNIKAELVLLTQELDAFQKQKRGLMQKLLTGTWRV